jgi:predicted ATPase/DNA-binding CsgD family transcriptional regulator
MGDITCSTSGDRSRRSAGSAMSGPACGITAKRILGIACATLGPASIFVTWRLDWFRRGVTPQPRTAMSPRRGSLPARAAETFIGREELRSRVTELLLADTTPDTPRLLTLTGPGGVGKTHLGLAAAAMAEPHFRDGAWLVDLTPYSEPDLVPAAIATALAHSDYAGQSVLESLSVHLASKHMLIVLDNCEHVIRAAAKAAARLLDDAPDVRFLVTSRAPLEILGERVVKVPNLQVPRAEEDQEVMSAGLTDLAERYDSVDLLLRRAEAAGAWAFRNTADPVMVARLVRQLDGIPLALVLVAPWLHTLPLPTVLADIHALLNASEDDGHGQRDAHDHHQSMTACIDWSYRLCSERSQKLWSRMSVFRGPARLDDVIAVCADEPGGDAIDGRLVISVLDGLVRHSVVSQQIDSHDQPRYYMPELTREYARMQLDKLGPEEAAVWHDRHAQRFLKGAMYMGENRFSTEEADLVTNLRRDLPHYRSAMEWLLRKPGGTRDALAILIQLCVSTAWFSAATIEEGDKYLARAVEQATGDASVPGLARVIVLTQLTVHAVLQRRADDAKRWMDRGRKEAVDTVRAAGSETVKPRLHNRKSPPDPMAYSMYAQGLYQLFIEEDPASVTTLGEAMRSFRTSCTIFHHFSSLYCAVAGVRFGDLSTAAEASQECLDYATVNGAEYAQCWAKWVRAWVEIEKGRFDTAHEQLQASLRTHQKTGTLWGLDWPFGNLAHVAAARGQYEYAAQLLGAATKLRTIAGRDGAGLFALNEPYERAERLTRAVLSESEYEAAFDDGVGLSAEQAVALALDNTIAPALVAVSSDVRRARAGDPDRLTNAQSRVARLVAEGLGNQAIAEQLSISLRTVESHISGIYAKLGFDGTNSAQARVLLTRWATEFLLEDVHARQSS